MCDYKYNWLKYIAVAYGPLTIFYFIIILFRISVTKGYMICYVTVSQVLTMKVVTLVVLNMPASITMPKISNSKYFYLESRFLCFIHSTLFSVFALISRFCRYSQKCLNWLRYRFHSLHIFMDAILGCYSHRPQERRYFAAINLILRIAHVYLINYISTPLLIPNMGVLHFVIYHAVAIFKPYKYNFIDIASIIFFYSQFHSDDWIIALWIPCKDSLSSLSLLQT